MAYPISRDQRTFNRDSNGADDESDTGADEDSIAVNPDLYLITLALEPGGTRQIKLRTASGGAQVIDVAYPSGTRFVSSDERIATVDEHGVITGLTAGRVTISVIHLTEGGSDTHSSKAAMLDALQLVETLPNSASVVYGFENSSIALPKIGAQLAAGDIGTLKTELLGLPKGATLSDGSRTFKATRSNTSLDLAGWNLEQLSLSPPRGFEGAIELQLRATSMETENGTSASITRQLMVNVLEGQACATPVGVNPFVRYLNSTALTRSSQGSTRIVASALVPVQHGCSIMLPTAHGSRDNDPVDSDESMEDWLRNLGHSIGNAFKSEVERGLRGEK